MTSPGDHALAAFAILAPISVERIRECRTRFPSQVLQVEFIQRDVPYLAQEQQVGEEKAMNDVKCRMAERG
jgi:hypothetical protein